MQTSEATQTTADELERTALLAELARPLVHEWNNFLNTLLLQLSLIEEDAPEHLRPDLAVIRRQGKNLATLTQEWQSYRKSGPWQATEIDLNEVVRDGVELAGREDYADGVTVGLQLAPASLMIGEPALELRRLMLLLIGNARAVMAQHGRSGTILVETEETPDGLRLHVQDEGPTMPEKVSLSLDLDNLPRSSGQRLVLAACQALAQRLHGTLQIAPRAEGGWKRTIVWRRGQS
jgi:C4-dicarboxylate-specific signal transduction histidine kinase